MPYHWKQWTIVNIFIYALLRAQNAVTSFQSNPGAKFISRNGWTKKPPLRYSSRIIGNMELNKNDGPLRHECSSRWKVCWKVSTAASRRRACTRARVTVTGSFYEINDHDSPVLLSKIQLCIASSHGGYGDLIYTGTVVRQPDFFVVQRAYAASVHVIRTLAASLRETSKLIAMVQLRNRETKRSLCPPLC